MTYLNSFMFVSIIVFLLLLNAGKALSANTFEPRLDLAGEYNDNLFLGSDIRSSDWIGTVEPGLKLEIDTRQLNLNLDYSLRFRKYKEHPELDETKIKDVQRAMLGATLFPGRDLTLDVTDEISRVVIDERNPNVEENDLENKTNLDHLTLNPRYRWHVLPTFDATFSYQFENYAYRSPAASDSTQHTYNLEMEKELVDKTKIRLMATYQDHRSETQSDYQVQRVAPGFSHPFGPHWTLSAEAGIAQIYFKTQPDDQDIVWLVQVDGQLTQRSTLVLMTDRSYVASVDAGATRRSQAEARLHYLGRTDLTGSVFFRESRFYAVERTDRSYGAKVRGEFPLIGQFVMIGRGELVEYRFQPDGETVERSGVGASLDYVARKGRISLGYTYRINESNIEAHDYTNSIVGLTISLRI